MSVLNTGRTKDPTLAAIARNIQMELASFDVSITVIHVPGKNNEVADMLSRWGLCANYEALHKYIQEPMWLQVPNSHLLIDWSI